MIRVVIVDDQPVVRAGVARILSPADGFEIVAECSDGDEVIAAVEAWDPDLVLMDVRMHRTDGVTATRELRARWSDGPPVLILTTFSDDDALWARSKPVLPDSSSRTRQRRTSSPQLVQWRERGAWLDSKVTPRILGSLRRTGASKTARQTTVGELTEREHDVLRLMARAASNTEIAAALFVSEATIKSHVGAIFSKLGARDRAAAIVFAFDSGIVVPDPLPEDEPRPRP